PVELGLNYLKSGLIFRRKLDRMRVGPTQAVGVREVEMRLSPLPSLGGPQGVRLPAKPCCHQEIEQRHVFEIAAAILGEEVAQDRAACLDIGLKPDKPRTAIGCDDMSFGEETADGAGIAIVRQALVDAFLPRLIVGDGKGHQLLKGQIAIAIELDQTGRRSFLCRSYAFSRASGTPRTGRRDACFPG